MVNLWCLKPILAKVTAVIAVAAPATIRTTGRRMASVMSGIHRAPVRIASSSNTTRRSGRRSVSVTQGLATSSGTRPVGATVSTPRDPALTMPGSSPQETSLKFTVNVEMVTTLLRRNMFVKELSYWS